MNVNVVANPLKTLKVYHILTKDETNKMQNEFQFTVQLNSSYFNLSEGTWNIGISEFIIHNLGATIPTIILLNVSTNLLSQGVKDPYSKNAQYISRPTPLATLFAAKLKSKEMVFDRFTPIYFQIENKTAYSFQVNYSEVPTNVHLQLNLGIHVTFLFQRVC